MPDPTFSIVIPTYNRSRLVCRAIDSALSQSWPSLEVLVIDDDSTDGTADVIRERYTDVGYFRQKLNSGVGAARNRGLHAASRCWVICLDDDDTLEPGALKRIAAGIRTLERCERYPVLQFAHTNGILDKPFAIVTLDDYLSGSIQGDFVPVIQKQLFFALGFGYPECIRAGEHLLWWRVAQQCGIPTWQERVGSVGSDAPTRINTVDYQIRYAGDYARLQERTLTEFGDVLLARYPHIYRKRRLGAAAYWALAGERSLARANVSMAAGNRFSTALGLAAVTFLPRGLAKAVFRTYRTASKSLRRR